MVKIAYDDTQTASDSITYAEWNAMVTAIKGGAITTENKAGSDCNGSSGDTSRVLTLSNTSLSSNEKVFHQGLRVHSDNYTVSHLAASSTITFDTIGVLDTDEIVVDFYT